MSVLGPREGRSSASSGSLVLKEWDYISGALRGAGRGENLHEDLRRYAARGMRRIKALCI